MTVVSMAAVAMGVAAAVAMGVAAMGGAPDFK